MGFIQSVAALGNQVAAGSVTISSTGSGNLLVISAYCSNGSATLTPSTTGTAQTFTSIANPKPAAGQQQTWYVPNCASGTTGITVTRSSGVGQWAVSVLEFSLVKTTSPLDQSANANSGGTTGTTGTTTEANEVWVAGFGGQGLGNGEVPAFSSLASGWTIGSTASSNAANPNSNAGIYTAYKYVASTGTANSTITGSNMGNGQTGVMATFKLAPLGGGAWFAAAN